MAKSPWQLPFPAAIDFFRKKRILPTENWKQISEQYQAIAFTIASITRLSILADVQEAIAQQLEKGISPEQFRETWRDIMTRRGWSSGFSPYRINLILSQNVRTAQNYGRFTQLTDPETLKRKPYWEWRWRDSPQPRPHHQAQDGKVYPANDPCFKAILPQPWGCRCSVFALSDRDMKREGLSLSVPPRLEDIAEPGFSQGFPPSLEDSRQQLVADAIRRLPPNLARLLQEDVEFQELNFSYNPNQPRDNQGRFAKKNSSATAKKVSKSESIELSNPQFEVVTDRKKLKKGFEQWQPILELLEGSATKEIDRQIDRLSQVKADKQKLIDKWNEPKDYRASVISDGKETYGDRFNPSEEVLEKLIQNSIQFNNNRISKVQAEIDAIDAEIKIFHDKKQKAALNEANLGLKDLDEKRVNAIVEIASNFDHILSTSSAKVAGVFDKDGNLQAIMNHSKGRDHVYIEFLASAPWGILPNHEKAVKGAGSAAIETAIKMSQEQGKGGKLKLMALKNAVPFYQKVGFEITDDDENVPEMRLSADKAQEFLARSRK